MSDMAACAAFVRARLDEWQAWAQMAQSVSDETPWSIGTGPFKADVLTAGGLRVAETRSTNVARHMVRHDPARVLAQVAALRAIVDLHEQWPVLVETPPEMTTATDDVGNMTLRMSQRMAWLTTQEYRQRFGDEPPTAPMLRHLAAIWDWHDDYDPAWAPD